MRLPFETWIRATRKWRQTISVVTIRRQYGRNACLRPMQTATTDKYVTDSSTDVAGTVVGRACERTACNSDVALFALSVFALFVGRVRE